MVSPLLTITSFIAFLTVVSCQIGFEVHVFNSRGTRISDSNPNPRDLYEGDFVYCLAPEASDDVHVYFAWVKLRPAPEDPPTVGPNFLSFPNEDDHTNRLYIGRTFGNGEPVVYSCIATDIDPYDMRDDFVGAQFRFRVVQPPDAGYIFDERDYAAFPGTSIDLACERHDPNAHVVWDTINLAGEQQTVIYDSTNPSNLGDDYSFPNESENPDDFMLRIEMSQDTAILTRCTITYNSLTDVSHTAMLFLIEFDNGGCQANGLEPNDGNNAGDIIRFDGCDVVTSYSPDSGITVDDFTTMTYWQETTDDEPTVFIPIDSSRTLDDDSVHYIQASPYTHGHTYSCTIEVHREEAAIIRAKIENVCTDPFTVQVNENTVRFRIYYGSLGGVAIDEFVEFNAQGRTAISPTTGDLICLLDRMPEVSGDDIIRMQERAPGGDWVDDDNHIIRAADIQIGHQYRCVFRDTDEPDNNAESGAIHMVNGFVATSIYNSDGLPLDSVDIHSINSGDYIECRSDDPIDPVYPPSFYWYRSNQLPNTAGPKTIRLSNTDEDTNRLPVSANLGSGDPISYRCIGADYLEAYIIPDFAGTLVKFQAILQTGENAGASFVQQDVAGMEDDTVEYSCMRNNADALVLWETINAQGERVELLYNSDDDNELPEGYVRTGTGDNFDLEITISQTTAILTRCTITGDGLSEVSSTAMIYLVSPVNNGGCRSSAATPSNVGDMVELRGCDANIVIHPDSGIINDDYQSVFYWEQQLDGENNYVMIDESRTLEMESVYHIEALSASHNSALRCGIQISRPNEYSASANVESICDEDVALEIQNNDVRFRIYYGQPENAGGDNFIDFSAAAMDIGKTDNGALTCQYDRHPAAANEDTFFMQAREGANGDWMDEADVIDENDVTVGFQYRCLFRDADGDDTTSNIIRIVEGINDLTAVAIFLNGEPLDQTTEYEINSGDMLTCAPSDDSVVVPRYIWYKSIQYNAVGPNIIQTDNSEDGSNRLYLHSGLGEGEIIGYRCIAGEDFGVGFTELLGTLVRFNIIGIDPQDSGSAVLTGSFTTLLVSFIAFLYNF